MADDITPLMTELNKLIETQTFSASAAEGIAKLRKRVEDADKRELYSQQSIAELKREKLALENKVERLTRDLGDWGAREAALVEREKKMTELEKTAAVESAVRDAYASMFDKMFANRRFRESNIDSHSESGYVGGQSTNRNVTHSITRDGEES